MASKLDDLLGNVVNRLKSVGIGEKGRYQLEREADPRLNAQFNRQIPPYITPKREPILRPPADTSGDVYYGLPESNRTTYSYTPYEPTQMVMGRGGLLSSSQGPKTVADSYSTLPDRAMSNEAAREYMKGDQSVAGQIELKPEYVENSRPSAENPQNREFEHPLTGITYVILPDGRTFEKDRTTQFGEADSLIMGTSGAPQVAGNPFGYIMDTVRSFGNRAPSDPGAISPERRPVTAPSSPNAPIPDMSVPPALDVPPGLRQTIDNINAMRSEQPGVVPVSPDFSTPVRQQRRLPSLMSGPIDFGSAPSIDQPILSGTDVIPLDPELGDVSRFRNMSVDDIRAETGRDINVNDVGDLVEILEKNRFDEPVRVRVLIENYQQRAEAPDLSSEKAIEEYFDSLGL